MVDNYLLVMASPEKYLSYIRIKLNDDPWDENYVKGNKTLKGLKIGQNYVYMDVVAEDTYYVRNSSVSIIILSNDVSLTYIEF